MFNLATPWILLLIPLPWVVRRLLPRAKVKGYAALKVPFYHQIKNMSENQGHHVINSIMPLMTGFLIWTLLVFAASGPQWLGKPVVLPQSGRDIMLAVDLSGSMRIPDMKVGEHYLNRLTVVKRTARKFIEARKGDRLGLILFGTKAYLQTPLTFDRKTVLQMLNDATIGLAGTQTAMGDAIGLAIKRLEKAPGKSKVLVLLTDGASNAGNVRPLDAASIAKKFGIKVYTIGIGANRIVIPGIFGPQVIQPTSALDESTLQEIAKMTNGLFFRAENGKDLERAYQKLNKIVPVNSEKNIFRPIKPLYPWPLGLALALSFVIALKRFDAYRLERGGLKKGKGL